MARQKRHETALKHTSVRVSDKHKFAMKVIARRESVSESIIFERTIERMADELNLSRHWLELWDDEESVRTLNLFALAEHKPTTKERPMVQFVSAHAQFFWADKGRRTPHRARAVILWPHLDDLEELWRLKKSEDYHVAAKAMSAILKKAKLEVPAFG